MAANEDIYHPGAVRHKASLWHKTPLRLDISVTLLSANLCPSPYRAGDRAMATVSPTLMLLRCFLSVTIIDACLCYIMEEAHIGPFFLSVDTHCMVTE